MSRAMSVGFLLF